MNRSKLNSLARKYFLRAGNALFVDGALFKAAGMNREAELAKQIHDLQHKLATMLEERAAK